MVKPGYKQTELGLLPEEWACREIGSFADVCMCKRIFAEQTSEMGEIPFYKIGTFGKKADAYISRLLFEEYKQKYSYPQEGDVLISAAGTLGRTVIYDGEEAYFQDSNIVWLDIDKSQISNDYLYHYYKVIKWTPSEGSTISRLYNGIITSTYVAVPPKHEQVSISSALSDIDALIINLEKLIAKKKAIKQGAMQELLTGTRRLPGFDGEWKTETWGDVLSGFSSGATPYRGIPAYYKGNIKWVSSGELNYNVIHDTLEHISSEAADKTSLTMHPEGTFLMAITGLEAEGTRGSCALLGAPATTNQSCMAIYSTSKMTTSFLFHYYTLFGDKLALKYCQGTKQQSYTAAIVKILPITYPVDIDEQNAITAVLNDMNSEISALEEKLTKALFIKSGMMSELLTGHIRLIDKEDM